MEFGFPVLRGSNRPFPCHLDCWLDRAIGIKGVPIPYGAPNANPFVERFNRTLREDAPNHFIFLSEGHVRRVCREFVDYYNHARPSQVTGAIPDPYPELGEPRSKGVPVSRCPCLVVCTTTTALLLEGALTESLSSDPSAQVHLATRFSLQRLCSEL